MAIATSEPTLFQRLLRLAAFSVAGLLAVPAATWLFTVQAESKFTGELRAALISNGANESERGREMVANASITRLCDESDSELAGARSHACGVTETIGQFHLARKLAGSTFLLGVVTLAWIGLLCALAWRVTSAQVAAFTLGAWSLRLVVAAEMALQGAMIVWLSFWLTAWYAHMYVIKLIVVAAVVALGAVATAVVAIFKSPPPDEEQNAERIDEPAAPELWARIRQLCSTLGTTPPAQVIGGVDCNFFVTEAPVRIPGQTLRGRSLFVSLPLLRVLEREEADAVLAHEMAHFRGGDTAVSAALGPRLQRFEVYMHALSEKGLTMLASWVLGLFRACFQLALSRASREREFIADAAAARLTSPGAIARALVKVAAYASYRSTVEKELFDHGQVHSGPLKVGERVAQGLAAFARSPGFAGRMADAAVPHPFDSHPPMVQRMASVGQPIPEADFAALAASTPSSNWVELIPAADAIEQGLWQRYEAAFASQHELVLAIRLDPVTDEELALVRRHFPDVAVPLKDGGAVSVTHAGFGTTAQQVAWSSVSGLEYADGTFGFADTLTVKHAATADGKTPAATQIKVKLTDDARKALKQVLGHYWQRHQIKRQLQRDAAAEKISLAP